MRPRDPRPADRTRRAPSLRPPVTVTTARGGGRRPPPVRGVRRRRRRRIVRGVLLALLAFFVWFAISFVAALFNPSYGTSLSARAAEWGRDHGLGVVVTWIETEWYRLHPPAVGGTPPAGAFGGPTVPTRSLASALPTPTRLHSPAGSWLPNEGVWHPAGRVVDGASAIYTTTVRPDAIHTSYVVGVAWMDPRLLRAQLYSGSGIPGGGPYPYTAPIS